VRAVYILNVNSFPPAFYPLSVTFIYRFVNLPLRYWCKNNDLLPELSLRLLSTLFLYLVVLYSADVANLNILRFSYFGSKRNGDRDDN
jgi:hypothetical protein